MASTLRSFAFGLSNGKNTFDSEFKPLARMVKNGKFEYEYAFEAVTGFLNKPDKYGEEEFNSVGFGNAVSQNQRKSAEKNKSKVVNLCDDTDSDIAPRNGDITIDRASSDSVLSIKVISDSYEEFENGQELAYAIDQIRSLNETFISDYSIDLIALINKAISKEMPAIEKLKQVCGRFEAVAELVKVILMNGDIESLTL